MKALLITLSLFAINTGWAQTWYDVSVPTTNKLNAIDFPSSTVGYIVGDSTTLLKTIDGGINWTIVNHTGLDVSTFSHELVDVDFVDESIGFVTMLNDNHGVYKTTDGGLNWIPASNTMSNMCYKSCTYINAEDDYLIGGAGCFQSAQIDMYQNPNWTISTVNYETFNPGQYVTDIDFNNGIGLASMKSEYILRSTDAGVTWDSINAGVGSSATLTSIMFISADTAYLAYENNGSGFGLYISTDAGLTWALDINSASFFYPAFLSLAQSSNGTLYTGGAISLNFEGIIMSSVSGSQFWNEQPVDHPINGIDSYGADVTFGVGDSGFVIVNTDFLTIGLIEDDAFDPISVYPNPATDFITIENEFNAPVVYNLVNAQGKVIISNIEVGDTKEVDISTLPSGVYFLKPTTEAYSKVHRVVKL